jgi:hypothetical protein
LAFAGDELPAGGLGCGNDFVETLIIGQRIVARTEAEIYSNSGRLFLPPILGSAHRCGLRYLTAINLVKER